MSAASSAGNVDGKASNPPHHQFKRASKALLLKIGFTKEQCHLFAYEAEQLCGARMQLAHMPESSVAALTLQNAARVHLFPRWQPLVLAGLQKNQEEKFWRTWMSSHHRTFLKKYTAGKWTQSMQFPDPPADSVSGSSSSSAPTITYSTAEDSAAITEDTATSHVSVAPALTAVLASLLNGTAVQSELTQGAAKVPEQQISSLRSGHFPVDTEPKGRPAHNIAELTWRDVKLKISFKRMHTNSTCRCENLNIPLVRCINRDLQDVEEDSKVVPAWLELSNVESFIIDHWNSHFCNEQKLRYLNQWKFALCTKFEDVDLFKIRNSNDFHLAFNKLCAQRSAAHDIWWIFCVSPGMFENDPDSEPSDSENPFSDVSRKRSAPSDSGVDGESQSKQPRTNE